MRMKNDMQFIKNKPHTWEMRPFKDFTYCTYEAPNWFHRKMQKLFFGIDWIKVDGENEV